MPFFQAEFVGPDECSPYVLRTFSHAGCDGFVVTRFSGEDGYLASLLVATAPDGSLLQRSLYPRIPLSSPDERLVKLLARKLGRREVETLAPFGWTYRYRDLYPIPNENPPPSGWEWFSTDRMAEVADALLARMPESAQDAIMAFEHTASFSWDAFVHASEEGASGAKRRQFVRDNPLIAATALMNDAARAVIDEEADLSDVLDAMSRSSKVAGLYGGHTVGKRAVKALSGLLGQPDPDRDPIPSRGVMAAAEAADTLPLEWLPRTPRDANAFVRVCAFATPMVTGRKRSGGVDWRFLLSNSKGDWHAYEARILAALEAPERESHDPVEYLWTLMMDMGHVIGDVLVPLAVRSTGALAELAEVHFVHDSHDGQPEWSLTAFAGYALRLDMNLPAMVSQAARHRRSRPKIRKALSTLTDASWSEFQRGYECPYDMEDDDALETMLRAWSDVFPKGWRDKPAEELVVTVDAIAERYRESLATRH